MNTRLRSSGFLIASVVAGALLPFGQSALAQDAVSISAIEAQIRQLQAEVRKLKTDAARRDAALREAREQAQTARAEASAARVATASRPQPPLPPIASLVVPQTVPAGSAVVTIPPNDKDAAGNPIFNANKPNGKFDIGGVTVTLGGFFDFTGFYRSRNENRGLLTSFSSIPFDGPTPQGDTGELNASAQATRLSLRADASLMPGLHLTGYVESDFDNGAGGANSVESSSYTPRLRQAFSEFSYAPWDAYLLGGQAWSLATPFKKGLDPFETWQPPVIEQAYMVGYDYLRTPLIRVVKGVGPAWFGLEADTPQTVFGGSSVAPTGGTVYTGYAGNGGFNPQTNYSVNSVPDFIAKAAVDTSFGHYELFGLLRQFEDQVAFPLDGGRSGGSTNNRSMGGGFGASAYVSVGRYVDLAGSIVTGHGIGRYGAAGLPDVTYAANGMLKPLQETMGEAGIIGHVLPSLDLYLFGGIDHVGSSYFGSTGGYGNPGANNTGCFNPNAGGTDCAGNNSQLSEITGGYNYTLWKGGYGTVQTGLQYAYIKRQAYAGEGGSPAATEHMVLMNLRWLPFQ